jgi:hypothetical protein
MNQLFIQRDAIAATGVVAGVIGIVTLLTWLAGLAMALRGSRPAERPEILQAYATCTTWRSNTTNSGQLTGKASAVQSPSGCSRRDGYQPET